MTEVNHTKEKDICNLGYSDDILRSIGRMLPFDWKKLGVYLEIPITRLDQMVKIKYPQEMALQVLQLWWSKGSIHSRWGELHYALASVNRNDLLSFTQRFCRDHSINYNDPDQMEIDRLLFKLSEKIAAQWKDLGGYLGISSSKMAEIGQQPHQDTSHHAFDVLKMWQLLPSSSHHQLIRVMNDDMNRGDVVRMMLRHFEKPRQGKIVCDCDDC